MKRIALSFLVAVAALVLSLPSRCIAQTTPPPDLARWQRYAANVTITRDDWGIAHVHGKSDADAVFGMIYAQAEDDFNRVETNYLNSLGRLSEADGQSKIYQDLRQKLFVDPVELKKDYAASPAWLQELMDAWADGLNFYLFKHLDVKPRVIRRFEPWMALSFTEGSIGGDVEHARLQPLEAFYSKAPVAPTPAGSSDDDDDIEEPRGSNGIAIAPSNTTNHHALLLINPHTSFFFRSELQMSSDEGLNAYGAVTWGQFFVYQGFNDRIGWMHTSSGVSQLSLYLEAVEKKGDKFLCKYGTERRPLVTKEIAVSYKTDSGMAEKKFIVYYTSHGPVIGESNGKWLTIRLMNEPVKALVQSYSRTKSTTYKDFRQTLELHTNSSNNTILADAEGNIAYFHGNFIPRRDPSFDWTKPVDGSNPATEWHGLLSVDETPHLLNPASGWLYNSNNWPWSAAGPSSPQKEDFPPYVETGTESARGLHVIRVLQNKQDFTLDSLIAAAYDSYLTWFEKPATCLLRAWDSAAADDPLKAKLSGQIETLRNWDTRWAVNSVPTSLAVFWGQELQKRVGTDARQAGIFMSDYICTKTPPPVLLLALADASDKLSADFGTWKTPWGEINRFQRVNDDISPSFNDADPSIPVSFTSSQWGSIASFGARPYPNTKKWYGTSGNSFVAVVEFGDKVRALAVTAGGESGRPSSPHFDDEAQRYATGNLREVYFYPDQLKGHTERQYHPGS
jgi:acyl-homoserine-lactone acylase